MEKTFIYLVENCFGDLNKVYIGKNKSTSISRIYTHQKTYGKHIEYNVIDSINSINKNDWKPLETYWIWQFRTWGFEVLNNNEGGGGCEFASDEMKQKISQKNKGKEGYWRTHNRSEESKQNMRKPKHHGDKISKANKGKAKPEGFGLKISLAKKMKPTNREDIKSCIEQLDLNNNFIKEWNCIKNPQIELKINNISAVCRGKQKTAGGFKWRYKNK